MGDFEYYSELVVFLESSLGQEFINRLNAKQTAHRIKKQSLAENCKDSIQYDEMKVNFLKEGIFIQAYNEILADIADLGALRGLVKQLKESVING